MSFVATAAIGGGLGLAQYGVQQGENSRQRQVQAAMEKYSPWTGQHGHPVANANPVADIAQGAVAGAGVGQGIAAQQSGQALQKGQLDLMKALTAHYAPPPPAAETPPPAQAPGQTPVIPWNPYGSNMRVDI